MDFFFLFLHTSNEFISGEKPLLTFLSNLSRSLLRLIGFIIMQKGTLNEISECHDFAALFVTIV